MNKPVKITGIASNAKSGAFVKVEEIPYYIDSLAYWPDNIIGKKVVVEGELKEISANHVSTDNAMEATTILSGPYNIIYNAKWKLIKKWLF